MQQLCLHCCFFSLGGIDALLLSLRAMLVGKLPLGYRAPFTNRRPIIYILKERL
jgi:hypothetical protein